MNNIYISDILLEKYLLNELPPKEKIRVDNQLKKDSELQKRLENIEKSNKDILENYSAEIIAANILNIAKLREKKDSKRKNSQTKHIKNLFLTALITTTAAITFFVFLPLENTITNISNNNLIENTTIKGEHVKLFIYRKKNNQVTQLENDAKAFENDLLQIRYQSTKNKYGVIFSVDGNGTITLQYPQNTYSTTKLKSSKKEALSNAYELDNAPLFEKFYFVTSTDEINIQELINTIKEYVKNSNVLNSSLPIDEKFEYTTITIIKE